MLPDVNDFAHLVGRYPPARIPSANPRASALGRWPEEKHCVLVLKLMHTVVYSVSR